MNGSLSDGYKVREYGCAVKRYCQTLDLKDNPELIAEYRRRHSRGEAWQEIIDGIKEVGILEMDIFIIGTRLFMIVETPVDFNWDEAFGKLAKMPGQSDWEAFVGEFQKAPEGASSTEKWQMMEQIFKLSEIKK